MNKLTITHIAYITKFSLSSLNCQFHAGFCYCSIFIYGKLVFHYFIALKKKLIMQFIVLKVAFAFFINFYDQIFLAKISSDILFNTLCTLWGYRSSAQNEINLPATLQVLAIQKLIKSVNHIYQKSLSRKGKKNRFKRLYKVKTIIFLRTSKIFFIFLQKKELNCLHMAEKWFLRDYEALLLLFKESVFKYNGVCCPSWYHIINHTDNFFGNFLYHSSDFRRKWSNISRGAFFLQTSSDFLTSGFDSIFFISQKILISWAQI